VELNRKRAIQIAAGAIVAILVILLLIWLLGRDDGPSGGPIVIVVSIEADDSLPLAINVDYGKMLADELMIDPDSAGELVLGEQLIRAVKEGLGDASIQLPDGAAELSQIGAVIVERIHYTGVGRDGVVRRIRLTGRLGDPPQYKTPTEAVVGVDDSTAVLYDVLPWPEDVSWRIVADEKLEVTSGETKLQLTRDQSGELASVTAEIPVRVEEVDDTAEIADGDDVQPPVVKRDLGKVRFTSKISVRYLGRLKIAEDKQ